MEQESDGEAAAAAAEATPAAEMVMPPPIDLKAMLGLNGDSRRDSAETSDPPDEGLEEESSQETPGEPEEPGETAASDSGKDGDDEDEEDKDKKDCAPSKRAAKASADEVVARRDASGKILSYTSKELRRIRDSKASRVWPDFLDQDFKNQRGHWDPDRWHQNRRRGSTPPPGEREEKAAARNSSVAEKMANADGKVRVFLCYSSTTKIFLGLKLSKRLP